MIDLVNIWKEYSVDNDVTFTALNNVSLKINQGEFCSIIGPSGSGKSTLMHIIGLLDKPSLGKVIVSGRDVSKVSDDTLSTIRNEFVGFVFQQFNLINKLTLRENILLPTVYSRKKMDYIPDQRATEIMERFGILSKANSYPNKISGGQQQRVAIARALIMSPKLILADEPTGNLDTKTGQEIINLLVKLNKTEKMTVVIVTHDPNIAKVTKRTIKIQDGEIVR